MTPTKDSSLLCTVPAVLSASRGGAVSPPLDWGFTLWPPSQEDPPPSLPLPLQVAAQGLSFADVNIFACPCFGSLTGLSIMFAFYTYSGMLATGKQSSKTTTQKIQIKIKNENTNINPSQLLYRSPALYNMLCTNLLQIRSLLTKNVAFNLNKSFFVWISKNVHFRAVLYYISTVIMTIEHDTLIWVAPK